MSREKFLDKYWMYLSGRGREESTIKRYVILVNDFVNSVGQKKRYDRDDVLGYLAELRNKGSSNNYRRYVFYVLKDLFNFLRQPWPLEKKDLPKTDEAKMPFFILEQAIKILDYVDTTEDVSLRTRSTFHLASDAWPRRVEIRNLLKKDIDFERREVFIRAKKHNLSGFKPLTKRTVNLLQQYFDGRSDSSEVAFYSPKSSDGRLSLSMLSIEFSRIMRRVFPGQDMRGYGYHSFRRFNITVLDQEGLSTKEQQKAGLWKTEAMPLRYRQFVRDREVSDKVRVIHPLFKEDEE